MNWQVGLVLLVGILAVSTAAILVRLAIADVKQTSVGFSLVLAASRLILAAIVLLPTWRTIGNSQPSKRSLTYAVAAGFALAIHFATWITSLSYTSIAASTTLVTTNPIWVALLSWFWLKEKPTSLTLLGIGVALFGGILIGSDGGEVANSGVSPFVGNFLALVGAWAASLYFLLGRQAQHHGLGINSYVTIAYSTAAVILLPLPILAGASYSGYSLTTYIYIGLMAVLPQLLGHTSLNWAVHWISPTLVSLAILFEPVISSILGYLIFGELPGPRVLVGALILLIGVWVAVVGYRAREAGDTLS